ncbi:serine hydrolase [Marinimicrobium sp. ABcell2]|uniref:serine hydrolase domain-containing protein n=1 Tax=Marinimicrobium sp. ABcell2 TaxID=3069751 RepID=UPI0027ADE12C|nr:serine hydrolase domain-containing protein [Marinimicrobium sp. ABcell2]MDQ2075975.1 serine hydrolase domain-containing protein [Marinimicrobium sp. ABcell2]
MQKQWIIQGAFAALLTLTLTACSGNNPDTQEGQSAGVIDQAAIERLNATLGGFVESGHLAGASVLIFEGGQEVYFNTFGMADREAGVPMSRDTLVQIFSMTKPITGVAMLTLYEQGKLDLDDPVSKFVPELADVRVYAGTDEHGEMILEAPHREITIRDLTRHTAGFANSPDLPGVGPILAAEAPGAQENTLSEMAEKMARVPLYFQPGERWSYGPEVDVLALVVERVSGQPFDAYVREKILVPLKMRETSYFVSEEDRSRFAAVYERNGNGKLNRMPDALGQRLATQRWALTPGGYGLTSSLDDYMRFARMLVNEGELDGARILQPDTVRTMATNHLPDDVTDRSWLPHKGQVGFGVNVAVRLNPPASAEENNGTVGEFFWDGAASTLFWVDPENDLAAILFVQLLPFDEIGLHKAFRDAVYGPFSTEH